MAERVRSRDAGVRNGVAPSSLAASPAVESVSAGAPAVVARPPAIGSFSDWMSKLTPRSVASATVIVLAVALAFWLVWHFRWVALTLIAGLFLHIAIKPAIDFLEKRGVNRRVGVALVYTLLFLALGGLIAALVPLLANQIGALAQQVPDIYVGARNVLIDSRMEALVRLGRLLPATWNLQQLGEVVGGTVDPTAAAPSPLLVFSRVGASLFYLLTVFGLGYTLTLHRERLLGTVLSRLAAERREGVRSFVDEVEVRVGQYVRGQLILSGVVGVVSVIVYWLIGVPYALVLGVVAALLEAVPMIGPVLTMIPAAILAATVSPQAVLYVLIAVAVIQIVESNVLVPRVMDKAVGVSPLVSILALTAFGVLFGLAGALLAIPLAAVIQLVLNRTVFQEPTHGATALLTAPVNLAAAPDPAAAGRSHMDLLRLEAGELAQDVRKQLRSAPIESANAAGTADEEVEDLIEVTADALVVLLGQVQPGAMPATVPDSAPLAADAARVVAKSSRSAGTDGTGSQMAQKPAATPAQREEAK